MGFDESAWPGFGGGHELDWAARLRGYGLYDCVAVSIRKNNHDTSRLMPLGKINGRRDRIQVNTNRACNQYKLVCRSLAKGRRSSDVLDAHALLYRFDDLELGQANQ